MKHVQLITFKEDWIDVGGVDDLHYFYTHDLQRVERSDEFIPPYVEVEAQRIFTMRQHQQPDRYIAASKQVWDYLYKIENPVTAETLLDEINSLKDQRFNHQKQMWKKDKRLKYITTASFWLRLKWLFTGVKV
ncbi:MAG: hypothetical protein MJK15_00635 [Colwellia sp.]|nr:hypothetical protein [Colwellia sp.]